MAENERFWIGMAVIGILLFGIWYFTHKDVVPSQTFLVTGKDKSGNVMWQAEIPVTQDMTQSVLGTSASQLSECGKTVECDFDYNSIGQK